MIFSYALVDESTYNSTLALAMSNSHFWNVGKKYIADYITHRETTADYWVGDRLICIGDRAKDLPYDLDIDDLDLPAYNWKVKDEDKDMRGADLVQTLDRSTTRGGPKHFTEPQELPFYIGYSDVDEPVGKAPAFKPWFKPFERGVKNLYNGGRAPDLHHERSGKIPSPWVLRNLTKREYTHEDDRPCGSFDHRLVVRLCWSKHISEIGLQPEPEELFHGPWAGDRFDIVPIEDLELVRDEKGKVVKVDGWKDVTDELSRLIDALCKAQRVSELSWSLLVG